MEKIELYETFLYCLHAIENSNGEDDPVEFTDNWLILERIKDKMTDDEITMLEDLYFAGFIDNQAVIDA